MQNIVSNFLKDISFYDINLDISVESLERNTAIKNDLIPFFKRNDDSVYKLKKINIELFDLVYFKEANLSFEHDLLKVVLFVSYDEAYEKFYDNLCRKYGKPKNYPIRYPLGKYYLWNDGQYELSLITKKSHYMVKFSQKEKINKLSN